MTGAQSEFLLDLPWLPYLSVDVSPRALPGRRDSARGILARTGIPTRLNWDEGGSIDERRTVHVAGAHSTALSPAARPRRVRRSVAGPDPGQQPRDVGGLRL